MIDLVSRKCRQCGVDYKKADKPKYSISQWSLNKYCSRRCSGEAQKVRDQYKNRLERWRRKRGILQKGTPEWLGRIKATTKEAMSRPDIKAKISQPRSPQSLATRIKHSNALFGKMPKNMQFGGSGNYPNIQRGDYENSKGSMYFRSKWEANYALYLDFLVKQGEIKTWEYEVDVFVFEPIQFGTRSYRPDFKVFNHDGTFEYHEVKGYMDNKSKTKLKRMAKYYPEVKLILVDSSYYAELKKKIGKVLNFY